MGIEKTPRGFSMMRFVDAEGRPCSIQDSSLAEEACLWLGRDGADHQVRMHLTQDMAERLVERLLHDACPDLDFLDRYGSRCVVRPSTDGKSTLEAGIVMDFEGRGQEPMLLSTAETTLLVPMLSTFVEKGSIAG